MKHKLKLLALGCLVSACGNPKLKITEVCLVNAPNGEFDCYNQQGALTHKQLDQVDKYTAFSVDNAQKLQAYVVKCEKAGVQP